MKINYLLVVLIGSLLLFISCGKPTEPESLYQDEVAGHKIITRFQTAAYAQDVVVKDNLCYIAQGEGGLMIVDIEKPEAPQMVSIASEGVRGYSTKIVIKDSVVYLAAGSYGVTVLNVSDPLEPIITASNLAMKPAKNLYIMGDYLFTSVSEQGIKIADISYATQPDIRGGVNTYGYARDVAITPDTNFLIVALGEMGMGIYDITDFQDGYGIYEVKGWKDTPGYAEAVVIQDEKKLAYFACGTAGLQIVNYADTANINIVGSYDGGGYAKEIILRNNLIYLTVEESGLQIIDVQNETNPTSLGALSLEYALGIAIDEDYIYVADKTEGLVIISLPN